MSTAAEKKLFRAVQEEGSMTRVLALPEDDTTYSLLGTQVCKDGSFLYTIKLKQKIP